MHMHIYTWMHGNPVETKNQPTFYFLPTSRVYAVPNNDVEECKLKLPSFLSLHKEGLLFSNHYYY